MSIANARKSDPETHVPVLEARAKLRQLTANAHEALHRQCDFAAILSGSLTISDYGALLNRLHSFHSLFEHLLSKAPMHLVPQIDFDARRKTHLLVADMAALGLPVCKSDISPLRNPMPNMRSAESLVGCLYVVEGAGLGGKVIARKLDYLLGHVGVAGRRFFWGRSDPDSLPWPKFCDIFESHAAQGNFDKIETAAIETFEALGFCLSYRNHV
jgi:heme oxygenase